MDTAVWSDCPRVVGEDEEVERTYVFESVDVEGVRLEPVLLERDEVEVRKGVKKKVQQS